MNQGGLKHAATDSRLDGKRERRRGASGRAAVLRRAPSDSDCSGETASLSADSGDRAVRPPPPPTRAAKSRSSRRRGSEWEVLEGLKDGQRFEKRPDVFNGYLHKKRKWPLKGWHKRFFVVDGGILVYARSPTDVARGRLHGSVDVGLSVISAKARRRRIDIDADEFIYHLRAKTPDVFRTWLNVLKAHRLYRQHLLTFGARESVPKIHPPLDDLPPTDTSSRSTLETTTISSSEDFHRFVKNRSQNPEKVYHSSNRNTFQNPFWKFANKDKNFLCLNLKNSNPWERLNNMLQSKHRSLCSMNCFTKFHIKDILNKSPDISQASTAAERQMHITDLESNSNQITSRHKLDNLKIERRTEKNEGNVTGILKNNTEPTYYFFSKKKPPQIPLYESPMRRSRKSTNLIKYRNSTTEPRLKEPLNNFLLLKNYKYPVRESRKRDSNDVECASVLKQNNEVQATVENKEKKSLQDVMSVYEYDKITERIMVSLFEKHKVANNIKNNEIEHYIRQVVRELYDAKCSQSESYPVKLLFRSLLEYWLKNTKEEPFKEAMKRVKSVAKPSNNYFTRDKILSSFVIKQDTKQTQFHGISDFFSNDINRKKSLIKNKIYKKTRPCRSPKRDTTSFEKERLLQETETILNNTVYVYESARSEHSNENDIKITKKLLDNLDKLSKKSGLNRGIEDHADNSQSSSEYRKILETVNHLISDSAIPPDVAKEFLNAYLCILRDSIKSMSSSNSSQISEQSLQRTNDEPHCEVITESVQKRASKSIITSNLENNKNVNDKVINQNIISSEMDSLTVTAKDTKTITKNIESNDGKSRDIKKHINSYSGKNVVFENPEDQSIVIDLSKYHLEHMYMHTDPTFTDVVSLSIQLKEKTSCLGKSKTQVSPKTCDNTRKSEIFSEVDWLKKFDSESFNGIIETNDINLRINYNFDAPNDTIELKPYFSTSDATSKAGCKIVHESEHSIGMSFKSSNFFRKEYFDDEDTKSCFIISSFKRCATTNMQSKKKVRLKRSNIMLSKKPHASSPDQATSSKYPEEYSVFERSAPRIIDEKFILLLLENLALLSKNLPSFHKELTTFYQKLKKRYDKTVRNSSTIQGLSLLGKIYNENDKANDCGAQIEQCDCEYYTNVDQAKKYEDAAIMTTNIINKDISLDKCVSTCYELHNTKTFGVQTVSTLEKKYLILDFKSYDTKNKFLKEYTCLNQAISQRIKEKGDPMQRGTSVQKWYETVPTKDCAISTIIKTVLDTGLSHVNYRTHENLHVTKIDEENKKTIYDRIEFVNEPRKPSTKPQTDKMKEKNHTHQDLNVYRLIVSKNDLRLSNSMIDCLLSNKSDDLITIYRCHSEPSYCSGLISPTSPPLRGPQAGFVSGTPGGRLAGWIIESGGPLDSASRELGQAQLSVQQLQRLLEALELQHQTHHDTDVSLEGASPNVKKDRRKFGLRKKKSNSKCASVDLAPPHIDPSNSHMALSALTAPPSPGGGASSVPNSAASLPIACAAARPQSLPGAESLGGAAAGPASLTSLTPDHQLREDFTVLAKDLVTNLKSVVSTLVVERGRLRAAVDAADSSSPGTILAALRTNLSSALHQNSELRSRLSRIHDASDLAEISSVGPNSDQQANRQFQQSLSYSSSCVSASEFFDAEEHDDDMKQAEIIAGDEAGVIELDGDSSSEAGSLSSEEGSASSDNSEGATEQVTLRLNQNGIEPRPPSGWSRRTSLPCPRPTPGGPSLWNLLYKNIGKDLSQISMPVTINEPLNMLQRLCEELEYSELLDAASDCKNAVERMALVAAFAVSAYASSAHRAASKPFNPLLAETYECVRDDKGFRFIAEQVSHHPPISACHAESNRWCLWQEARIKTKFWGKSMEFQPAGRVHVRLASTGDHYSWNKVTTCVHNLFGGQRWVDQYGDMHITCHGTDITCKLNFIKASSWSSSRHEVRGAVTGAGTRLRLQGRWSEALYAGEPPAARCLWRPGAMPPDHELYYGFTRFAMELNELEPGMREILPHTDTRLRPDQRALEEGNVEAAEQLKHELEQAQRERRRDFPDHVPVWFRKSMESGEEMWVFTGEYWKARDAGFVRRAPAIW